MSTRSKGIFDTFPTNQKHKSLDPPNKDKGVISKSNTLSLDSLPTTSNSPSSSNNLTISDTMEYNIVEDMEKVKANISL